MPILCDELPVMILEKLWKSGFRGVFMGGCIERKEGSSIRRSAHAHGNKKGKYFGWICMKSGKPERFVKNGKLSNLAKHELSHIVSATNDHGKEFCNALIDLGGRKFKNDYAFITKNLGKIRRERKNKYNEEQEKKEDFGRRT
jgi:hypothetical protein